MDVDTTVPRPIQDLRRQYEAVRRDHQDIEGYGDDRRACVTGKARWLQDGQGAVRREQLYGAWQALQATPLGSIGARQHKGNVVSRVEDAGKRRGRELRRACEADAPPGSHRSASPRNVVFS